MRPGGDGRRARCGAEVRFLQPPASATRRPARASRCPPASAALARERGRPRVRRATGGRRRPARVGLRLAAARRAGVASPRVENTHRCARGARPAPRRSAASLLSTHPVLGSRGGRFHLAARRGRRATSVNTFPVLATAADDAVLGAAIVLPDHPQIAPESRGGLFDSTEIEEALLLHVQRADRRRARGDRRAGPGGARDGRARGGGDAGGDRPRCTAASSCATRSPRAARAASGLADPSAGEPRPTVDGVDVPAGRQGRSCAPARDADLHDAPARRPRRPRSSGSIVDYDGTDAPRRHGRRRPRPGADARDRPVPVLLRPRGGGDRAMSERAKQILVAGVGNAWLRDDGFGGEVAQAARERELPAGVAVFDFGTGGLDLAYEVMRGYDALVLVDVSRQGGEPGTLYVMEPDEESTSTAGSRTARRSTRTGWTRRRCCASSRRSARWPGKVVVIACEPAEVEEMGFGLSPQVEAAVERAVELVVETVAGARSADARRTRGGVTRCTSCRSRSAIVEHGVQARRRAAGDASSACGSGACGRSCRTRSSSTSSIVARDTVCEGARLEQEIVAGAPALPMRVRRSSGRSRCPAFRCPACGGGDVERRRAATSSRWSRSRSRRPHASHEGEGRRGRARRQQHDRAGQPRRLRPRGRHGRELHERARRRQDDAARARRREPRRACASACSRATCRARWTPTGSRSLHVPVTQLNTDPGFGGECHLDANMVRSALPCAAARRDRPAGDRERRQPRLPGRVPRRRGRRVDGRPRSPRARTSRSSTR